MGDFDVDFINCMEIRMGSPFRNCDLKMKGTWRPALPNDDWLPILSRSVDGRFVGLVRWNTSGNEPGFHIYTIDNESHKIDVSDREFGLCASLRWDGARFLPIRG